MEWIGKRTKQEPGNTAARHQEPDEEVGSVLTVRDDGRIQIHSVLRLLQWLTRVDSVFSDLGLHVSRFLFVQHHAGGRGDVKGLLEALLACPTFFMQPGSTYFRGRLPTFCVVIERENALRTLVSLTGSVIAAFHQAQIMEPSEVFGIDVARTLGL